MYSRKKIPAPFCKPQKKASKINKTIPILSPQETISLHAEEKNTPQGGGSPLFAMLLFEMLSAKKE